MAKPPSVNSYRHRKNKHRQVITYEQPDGSLKVTIIDFEKGKVTTFEEKEEEGESQGGKRNP